VATEVALATARLLRHRLLIHDVWLPVDGESMQPTIAPPAEVRVVARRRPRMGEVWAFVGPDGSIVVHRYERRSRGGLVFHGDALVPTDPVTAPDVLVGRVVAARDRRGERALGTIDQLRGGARYLRRRVRSVVNAIARWAVSLISRPARPG